MFVAGVLKAPFVSPRPNVPVKKTRLRNLSVAMRRSFGGLFSSFVPVLSYSGGTLRMVRGAFRVPNRFMKERTTLEPSCKASLQNYFSQKRAANS